MWWEDYRQCSVSQIVNRTNHPKPRLEVPQTRASLESSFKELGFRRGVSIFVRVILFCSFLPLSFNEREVVMVLGGLQSSMVDRG